MHVVLLGDEMLLWPRILESFSMLLSAMTQCEPKVWRVA
jgi:hypothetical protein